MAGTTKARCEPGGRSWLVWGLKDRVQLASQGECCALDGDRQRSSVRASSACLLVELSF